MARPLRIQYSNAWYHVMNRGAGRKKIFKSKLHRLIFIDLLKECHSLFNVKIHAYCLMDNHYHLLLSTPDANLSRVMRHLNGVYTQKYNKSQKTDGSLFRGRYQAQLIEDDCYQLMVSRYIHLNPVEAKIVKNPVDYEWSSYAAYLGLSNIPDWLSINIILDNLKEAKLLSHIKNYKDYVEEKTMEEINVYTAIKNTAPIFGSEVFKQKVLSNIADRVPIECSADLKKIKTIPEITKIIEHVCNFYKSDRKILIKPQRGIRNWPRLICIYICRQKYGHTLRNIANYFGFKRQEAVSASIHKFQLKLKDPNLIDIIDSINSICDQINASIAINKLIT